MTATNLFKIPLDQIEDNPVALRAVDETSEAFLKLTDSVKRDGILQSISVVPSTQADGRTPKLTSDGRQVYRIIDGLHRTTAARKARLDGVPAQVMQKSEAEAWKLQLIANSHKIETKRVEYAKHLGRILAADPTMTAAQLAAELCHSPGWLNDILGLQKLSEEIGKLVDSDDIPVSNAIELSKLPKEEQQAFISAAMTEQTSVFGPKVRARVKELREAKRAGRDPNAPKHFIPVPHQRKFREVLEVYTNPSVLVDEVNKKGLSDPVEIIKFVLEWGVHMDAASIEKAKADAEARKKAEEAEKAKRRADQAAQKAQEAAAAAAAIETKQASEKAAG